MDQERHARTIGAMDADSLDALVCRLPENIVMLSGHWPLNGLSFLVVPRSGDPTIIVPECDERETRADLPGVNLLTFVHGVLTAGDFYRDVADRLGSIADGRRWTRIGYEGSFESIAPPWNAAEPAIPAATTHAMLAEVFGADHLVDATSLIMKLRECKTTTELDRLRIANEISAMGLAAFRDHVDVGLSGVELVAAVERAVLLEGTGYRGAKRVRAFAQVSTGPEETAIGYRPMEISTQRSLEAGDLALLELAVVADGLWSDRTRARVAGTPSQTVTDRYGVVRAAQQAAIDTIRTGAATGDIDRAARWLIHDAGYTDDEFLHVTGHGLGFRYHEPVPLLLPGGTTVLETGMTCTVEPGLYRTGIGGLRVEDNVIIGENGAEVMGPFEQSLTN